LQRVDEQRRSIAVTGAAPQGSIRLTRRELLHGGERHARPAVG
jgi:hypothetical protein